MKNLTRATLAALLAALGLCVIAGCAQREHKQVRIEQEQREGEVQEERPGEMVVE